MALCYFLHGNHHTFDRLEHNEQVLSNKNNFKMKNNSLDEGTSKLMNYHNE